MTTVLSYQSRMNPTEICENTYLTCKSTVITGFVLCNSLYIHNVTSLSFKMYKFPEHLIIFSQCMFLRWVRLTKGLSFHSHRESVLTLVLTLALVLEQNTLVPIAPVILNISISANISIEIQMGSWPIQKRQRWRSVWTWFKPSGNSELCHACVHALNWVTWAIEFHNCNFTTKVAIEFHNFNFTTKVNLKQFQEWLQFLRIIEVFEN